MVLTDDLPDTREGWYAVCEPTERDIRRCLWEVVEFTQELPEWRTGVAIVRLDSEAVFVNDKGEEILKAN